LCGPRWTRPARILARRCAPPIKQTASPGQAAVMPHRGTRAFLIQAATAHQGAANGALAAV
jgi:hypothetical protein